MGITSVFWLMVYCLIPPGIFLAFFQLIGGGFSFTNWVMDRVLFSKCGCLPYPFITVILLFTGIMSGTWGFICFQERNKLSETYITDSQRNVAKMTVWRHQRNLYLSTTTLLMWWLLYAVHRERVRQREQEEARRKRN